MTRDDTRRTRREFLGASVRTAGALAAASALTGPRPARAGGNTGSAAGDIARDEAFWSRYRSNYAPDPSRIWLNCLAFNPVARGVQDAFTSYDRKVGEWPLSRRRAVFPAEKSSALRARLARMAGATPEEIAFTRNTTEGLANIIFGLPLSPGDEVIITTQDYAPLHHAWRQRAARDRIVIRTVQVPAPPRSSDEIVDVFRSAFTARTKVVALPHISDPTGLIFPVRDLVALAHARDAQVIVDGALSFGVIPVDLKALDCDYFATSLHKGVFAPTGTGFMYVRRDRIRALWPLFGADAPHADSIRKFEYRGTSPVAQWPATVAALDLHDSIGIDRFAARYRYLKSLWMQQMTNVHGILLRTSNDAALSCGIGLVHLEGIDVKSLHEHLYEKEHISTWPIQDPEYQGLWVSPYPFTTKIEIDRFARALLEIRKRGLPERGPVRP
jgi:isopenicillin-N epimerase